MTIKKLDILVRGVCYNCPFCRRSEYYSVSEDSGFDCENPEGFMRIANDKEVREYTSGKTKKNPMWIPDWCPLPDDKSETKI